MIKACSPIEFRSKGRRGETSTNLSGDCFPTIITTIGKILVSKFQFFQLRYELAICKYLQASRMGLGNRSITICGTISYNVLTSHITAVFLRRII